MPRAGLTPERVTQAAASLVDRHGVEKLTLAAVAHELGVRTPSLYNHVGGLDDLRRSVALLGIDRLAETTRSAVMGRSGGEAIRALARAYRCFALDHPGVYRLTQVSRPDDAEYADRSFRAVEPTLAVLAGYGIDGDAAIHAARALRSALHGFASLETAGGFGIDLDPAESFDLMVDMLDAGLARLGGPSTGRQVNESTSQRVRPWTS